MMFISMAGVILTSSSFFGKNWVLVSWHGKHLKK